MQYLARFFHSSVLESTCCGYNSHNVCVNNHSITVKLIHKGGGIYIMNTRNYLSKVHKHLQDHNTNEPLTLNLTNATGHDVGTLIHYMYSQHITDMATMEFLLPSLLWVKFIFKFLFTFRNNTPYLLNNKFFFISNTFKSNTKLKTPEN